MKLSLTNLLIRYRVYRARPKYRIIEVVTGDGTVAFYVQIRIWLRWKYMKANSGWDKPEARSFKSYDDANHYCADKIKKALAKVVVKKQKHQFNEVFHKLKTTGQKQGSGNNGPRGGAGIY